MNFNDLFPGIAVVIDDDVNNSNNNIYKILNQIEQNNIPCIKYTELPSEQVIRNLKNVSFVILDWDLLGLDKEINAPAELKKDSEDELFNFLKLLKDTCFCAVFLFSDLNTSDIADKLEINGLYSKNKPSNIFIKRKSVLAKNGKLFEEIENWVEKNPQIYVLKEWENEYQRSKIKMFLDFYELSPIWPFIIWNSYDNDGVNASFELSELLLRNLYSRLAPINFSGDILKKEEKIEKEEICRVLEGSLLLDAKNLSVDNISTGDIFKISQDYYLNIRPSCDLIPGRGGNGEKLDDIELFLLKGSKLTSTQVNKKYSKDLQHFLDHEDQIVLFPIDGGKAIDFRFKDLHIKTWAEIKDKKRIGRLIPPYITRVQQKYSLYNQRQGLPSIPYDAISD